MIVKFKSMASWISAITKSQIPFSSTAISLREAVERCDHEEAFRLIQAGQDASEIYDLYRSNYPTHSPYEESLLQLAARLGDLRMIQILIQAGAPVEEENFFQIANRGTFRGRPIHVAAAYGRVEVIKALAAAGSSASAIEGESDGIYPMAMAAMFGHVDVIDCIYQLLKKDDGGDKDIRHAFAFACMYCQFHAIYYFLDLDLDESPLPYDCSPLHFAFRRFRYCFEKEGNIPIEKSDKDVSTCVQLLLHLGADPNGTSTYNETEYSILSCAILHRQVDVVKILLEWDADVDSESISPYSGVTEYFAMHCAVEVADPRCMEVLLEAGAGHQLHSLVEVERDDKVDLITGALHMFGSEGDSLETERMQEGDADKVLAMLLEAGLSLEARTTDFETPLHTCCTSRNDLGDKIDRGTHACMRALLRAGANVHAVNNERRTPLHKILGLAMRFVPTLHDGWPNRSLAIKYLGREEISDSFKHACAIISDLLVYRSDIYKQDAQGTTPLQLLEEFITKTAIFGGEALHYTDPIAVTLVANYGEPKFVKGMRLGRQRWVVGALVLLNRYMPGETDLQWKIIADIYRGS